jgi:hypothetical protein
VANYQNCHTLQTVRAITQNRKERRKMIVYDTEIKKCIPDARGTAGVHDGSIEYCGGWSDYEGMGISVLCAFDTDTGTKHTFTTDDTPAGLFMLDGNMHEFAEMVARTDYVIGFNNHSFDNKLVAAHGVTIPPEKSFDIYVEVIDAAGLSNAPFSHRKGYKLDDICRANQIEGKTGHGLMAPVMFQKGRYQELLEYCQHDVQMTVQVLERILHGQLICPKSGNVLRVQTPAQRLGTVQRSIF